jgi:hypothetical protein
MVVNFRSFDTLCGEPVRCPVVVADTTPQQGQGTHGSFSRAETWNFMALAGPDFKSGFIDTAPVSNADIGRMVAAIMQLDFKSKGVLTGRVLTEAMRGGVMPDAKAWSVVSESRPQTGCAQCSTCRPVGTVRYFDAGGFRGRTLGLSQDTTTSGR